MPASRSRPTTSASRPATFPASLGDPAAVTAPATSIRSLTATGTPCSGPTPAPPRPPPRPATRALDPPRPPGPPPPPPPPPHPLVPLRRLGHRLLGQHQHERPHAPVQPLHPPQRPPHQLHAPPPPRA